MAFVLKVLHRIGTARHWRVLPLLSALAAGLLLSACAGGGGGRIGLSERVVNYGEPVPKGGGKYKTGSAYQVANQWFQPRENRTYDRVGIASWYGDLFHGRRTANGEVFDMDALTAAHPTLPMPVLVEVTNLENGRQLVVRVNDRGPYKANRVIDLSRKSATLLGFRGKGTARVRVRYLRDAPLDGDDSFERNFAANMANRPPAYYPAQADAGTSETGYRQLRSIGPYVDVPANPVPEESPAAPSPAEPAAPRWSDTAFDGIGIFGYRRR
jgi:rare lipoprotein A